MSATYVVLYMLIACMCYIKLYLCLSAKLLPKNIMLSYKGILRKMNILLNFLSNICKYNDSTYQNTEKTVEAQ